MERSAAIKLAVLEASKVLGVSGFDVEGARYNQDKWLITLSFQRTEQVEVSLNQMFGISPDQTTRLARVYKVIEVPDVAELDKNGHHLDEREYVIRNPD